VALPVILYGQFEGADRQTRELVAASLRHHDWLIAQALAPILDHMETLSAPELSQALQKFSEDGTVLKLMLRPKFKTGAGSFFFVAAAPQVSAEQTRADFDLLAQHGILKSLGDSCSTDLPVEVRYQQLTGKEEILTSILPINSHQGCWALISANNSSAILNTAFGRPYWQTENMRMAALIYFVFAVLAVLIVVRVGRALRHFRDVAREIRQGGAGTATFASRNMLPELSSVAADFDLLVRDLFHAASDIRRTAEDTAHAVKSPLAIIRSALHPLKGAVEAADHRSQRAIELIDAALTRLSGLISTAQRLSNDTADFIEAPRRQVDLTEIVNQCLHNARHISAERDIRFLRRLDKDAFVLAPDGILDVIVENILDNAIGFSLDHGTITTFLSKSRSSVVLQIADEGPGIDPNKIDRIFERNFSFRPNNGSEMDEPGHAGLGLWIVRHHVEALGGQVRAENRKTGGLTVHITLPIEG
jgi:two-component system sensor histidine kinase ChvG